MQIPPNPDALTPEWLTSILRERGVLTDAAVTAIAVEPLAEQGATTRLARLRLTVTGDQAHAPRTMIAKFSATDPAFLESVRRVQLYEHEVRFYEEFAHTINLRTPRCYYSAFDASTLDHIILLEDLAPARAGSMFKGGTLQETEQTIREIASLHIRWWDHPQLEQLDWLKVPGFQDLLHAGYQDHWRGYVARVGDMLSAEMRLLVEKLHDQYLRVTNPLYEAPLTLIHRDLQFENVLFDVDGDSLAVIDWQWVTVGRGPFDVAWLMAANIDPAVRKAHEIDLLRMYHGLLVDGGIRDYTFDHTLEDYRRGVLNTFAQRVISIGAGRRDDQLERKRTTIIPRMIAAVEDLKCHELLV